MKRILGIIAVTGICLMPLCAWKFDHPGEIRPEETLPHVARAADIIGIAKFKGKEDVSSSRADLTFEMQQLWVGTLPTQTLAVAAYSYDGLPPLETECVIFVNTHDSEYEYYQSGVFRWEFVTNRVMYVAEASFHTYEFVGTNSFFRADADGGERLLFASNLVHRARIAPDEAAFLSLLYANSTNATHSIAVNVDEFLREVISSATKEELLLWFNNPKIPEKYRARIRNRLWNKHGTDPLGIYAPFP